MSSKLPYIPLYIGDWEKDTNWITLEAEGALLKLIFKLWIANEKGRMKIGLFQLSILFKKSMEDTMKIMKELEQNQVLNIEFLPDNMVSIESRRLLRERNKSEIFSENGKRGGRPKSRMKAKVKPNADNEYENDIENEDECEPDPILKSGGIFDSEQIPVNNKKEGYISINGELYLASQYKINSGLLKEWSKVNWTGIEPDNYEDLLEFIKYRTETNNAIKTSRGMNGILNNVRGAKVDAIKKLVEKTIDREWVNLKFYEKDKETVKKDKWADGFNAIR